MSTQMNMLVSRKLADIQLGYLDLSLHAEMSDHMHVRSRLGRLPPLVHGVYTSCSPQSAADIFRNHKFTQTQL